MRGLHVVTFSLKRSPIQLLLALALCLVTTSGCDEEVFIASNQEGLTAVAVTTEQQGTVESAGDSSSSVSAISSFSRIYPECDRLRIGPPQGISCLQCTHANAREQADALTDLLLESCLRNISVSYLVDGSFGAASEFEDFLKGQIEKLTTGDRSLFLYLYFGNGPWQRRSRNGKLLQDAPYLATLSPREFRAGITSDFDVQYEYQKSIVELHSLLRYASARGSQLAVIPMLEDNLDDQSFETLYELTLDALPLDVPVSILRSACSGCFPGNDDGLPDGVGRDIHTANASSVRERDGLVTNDGTPFRFASDTENIAKLTLSDLAPVRDRALSQNNAFLLWSARYQGLDRGPNRRNEMVNPNNRIFPLPTADEAIEIINFLNSSDLAK